MVKPNSPPTTPSPISFFDKAIEYLFYALFFFVPLILWPKTSEVFEFNKMLLVYILTILIGAAWVGKWLLQKKITIRRTPLDIPILIFVSSQILSTFFSIDTHTSLWGYYSRFHGGLMSTLAYATLYYAFVTNVKISNIKYQVLNILISATLVSIYGVLERLGIDKNLWVQDVQNRVFSTLGQPNWLSAYLVALLPLPIFMGIAQKKSKLLSTSYFLLSTLFLSTIWFTKSQSGIGATTIILFLIVIYLFLKTKKILFRLAVCCLLIAALAIVIYKWDFVQKLSPFGVANLNALVEQDNRTRFAGSDSMVIRQVVWQGARQIAKQHPLFGTGLETFGYSYYAVRPAAHNLLSEWEFLYNKAHNEYLNFLANTGFFGLFSYLLLIGWTLIFLSKAAGVKLGVNQNKAMQDVSTNRAQHAHAPSVAREHDFWHVRIAMLFGYLSILITNYFGFSVVPVAIFFFLFPALVFTTSNQKEDYLSINFHINSTLGLLSLSLITFYFLLTPYHQWRADLAYNQGKFLQNSKYLKESLSYLEKAVSLIPSEPTFVAELASAQAIAAITVKQQLNTLTASDSAEIKSSGEKMLADFIDLAETNAQKAITMNPHQTNYYKSKAKVELYLGTIKPEYNRRALETLKRLMIVSPTEAKIIYNIGLLYDTLGDTNNAKLSFQQAIKLKPDYGQAIDYLNRIN